MLKYKIGDKVIVNSYHGLIGIPTVTPTMKELALKVVTICGINGRGDYYFLTEDSYGWHWDENTILRLATEDEIARGYAILKDDENYTTCEDCGARHLVENTKNINGRTVCLHCATRYGECHYCGTAHRYEELSTADGYHYACDDCVSERGHTCSVCGNIFIEEETIEDDGVFYCQCCYDEKTRAIHEYHYGHDVPVEFFGSTDENALYMGAEIEVDCEDFVDEDDKEVMAKEMKNAMPHNFVSMETDGSLDYGFENITMPATMEYHYSIMEQYKNMFNIAISGGMLSHKTKTCGLHVHFNRSFYEDREEECLAKLLYLVETHWDNLVKFSRRNYRQLERWANKYDKSPEEVIKDMKDGRAERYSAVNLTNKNTIEFRLFRGTLRLETYIATLQLVDTMVKFSKSTDIEDLRKMQFTDFLLYPEIKEYWETVKNRQIR